MMGRCESITTTPRLEKANRRDARLLHEAKLSKKKTTIDTSWAGVLTKGVEEAWATEGVVKFIDSLRYREITLKGDKELAIVALGHRVAECRAEQTTEGAVKGDKQANGFIENAVVQLRDHQNNRVSR